MIPLTSVESGRKLEITRVKVVITWIEYHGINILWHRANY
ncbi:hypothetical protein SAMN05216225_1002105 [Ornithinibacillus halophilus]|uniref:Uncharacterized protein n=1 Tax=Ornithinibacillus halophilus TaxID=930117 RepID=A0A1M5DL20_9BACI|nr:hypothetical protein SAMN05216225_1002105 [Ornithinibacillus halophilus]